MLEVCDVASTIVWRNYSPRCGVVRHGRRVSGLRHRERFVCGLCGRGFEVTEVRWLLANFGNIRFASGSNFYILSLDALSLCLFPPPASSASTHFALGTLSARASSLTTYTQASAPVSTYTYRNVIEFQVSRSSSRLWSCPPEHAQEQSEIIMHVAWTLQNATL